MKKIHILLIALYLIGCKSSTEEGTPEALSVKDTTEITVDFDKFRENRMALGKVRSETSAESIRTTGMIDVPPENRVEISPLMGGYVTYNPLLIGDRVKKGQLLLSLEDPQFVTLQQEYLEIKQKLEYLKEEYERNKKLLEEQITSRKNFLRAESEYLTANARYHGLRKQLQLLNLDPDSITAENISPVFHIYAPISGSITEIHASRGSYIQSSQPAMVIINNDHLHLELNIFEKDVLKVKKGQPIAFKVPEASNEVFPAEVHLISDALSRDRTIRVHGHIDDTLKNHLVVGMYVEADIFTDAHSDSDSLHYTVPTSAVIEKRGSFFILMLKSKSRSDYSFQILPVTPGIEINDRTEILAPQLDTTINVLARGAFDLLD